jgi:hypothetical protein
VSGNSLTRRKQQGDKTGRRAAETRLGWNWRLAIAGVGLDLGKGNGKGVYLLLGITSHENDERHF